MEHLKGLALIAGFLLVICGVFVAVNAPYWPGIIAIIVGICLIRLTGHFGGNGGSGYLPNGPLG